VDICLHSGSAKGATKNKCGDVYIKLIHEVHTMVVATEKYCNNYNDKAAALVLAAQAFRERIADARDKLVLFTDAISVVTALKSKHTNDLSDLKNSLESLTQCYQKVVIQWVPAHCDIAGNEVTDKLAKQGEGLQQEDLGSTYDVAKTIIKGILS
jgi:ribonuclease HI